MDKENARPGGKGDAKRPRIKKVVKKSGGHHGGSWKVAYADFVTAMMAFFLLMWLLGAVDQETRAGVAAYFQRPLLDMITQGEQPGGDRLIATSDDSPQSGTEMTMAIEAALRAEAVRMERVGAAIVEIVSGDSALAAFREQLRIEMTPEGLRIQLVDRQHRSMFARGSAVMEPFAWHLLVAMAPVLDSLSNPIILTGHTDAAPYAGASRGYSNWELSVDRANAARRALVEGGLDEKRLLRVEGLAATVPANADDPLDPANRRISLLLLNTATADSYRQTHVYH